MATNSVNSSSANPASSVKNLQQLQEQEQSLQAQVQDLGSKANEAAAQESSNTGGKDGAQNTGTSMRQFYENERSKVALELAATQGQINDMRGAEQDSNKSTEQKGIQAQDSSKTKVQ